MKRDSTFRRHKWREISRVPAKTERECIHCRLLKVSRHEGNHHWIEWWKPQADGMPIEIRSNGTPPCEPVKSGAVI